MNFVAALVLFACIWFVALLASLPIGLKTQGEAGEVVPGTPSSAPADFRLGRKVLWVTVVTFALWLPLCAFLTWGGLTVRDIDFFHRM